MSCLHLENLMLQHAVLFKQKMTLLLQLWGGLLLLQPVRFLSWLLPQMNKKSENSELITSLS